MPSRPHGTESTWRRRWLSVATAGGVAGVMLVACGSSSKSGNAASGPSSAATVTLKAQNTTYSPTDIQLKAGQKVTFVVTNGDQIEHNLTIKALKVNKDVKAGTTEKATASVTPGTYEFHCEYHPDQMKGTITVT